MVTNYVMTVLMSLIPAFFAGVVHNQKDKLGTPELESKFGELYFEVAMPFK